MLRNFYKSLELAEETGEDLVAELRDISLMDLMNCSSCGKPINFHYRNWNMCPECRYEIMDDNNIPLEEKCKFSDEMENQENILIDEFSSLNKKNLDKINKAIQLHESMVELLQTLKAECEKLIEE